MSTPAPTRPDAAGPAAGGAATIGFTIRPKGNPELTDALCDRLFKAGCDDASPGVTAGVTDIPFDREAASLDEALRSAVAQVRSAGLEVEKIVLDRQDLARLLREPEPTLSAEAPPADRPPADAPLAAAA